MKKIILAAAMFLILVAFAVHAQSAKDLQGVPLYEGFVRDDALAKNLQDWLSRTSQEQDVKSVAGFDFWSRSALVEDVIQWYAQKLAVANLLSENAIVRRDRGMVMMVGSGMSADVLSEQGKPGSVSQVTVFLYEPQLTMMEGNDENPEDFGWKTQQYEKTHKKIAGQYCSGAVFEWTKMEANGDVTRCAVRIQDWSIDARKKTYAQNVKLRITLVTKPSPKALAAAQKARAADQQKPQATDTSAQAVVVRTPPAEATLGVPVYPGAVFAADGRSISMAQLANYVWESKDSIDAILGFYEKSTGKKRMPVADKSMGVLMLENVVPGKRITIMATTNGAPAGTTLLMIQVQ